jgi:uncharacterized cupin superfamily protein
MARIRALNYAERRMPDAAPILLADARRTDLADAPIAPDTILDGAPVARSSEITRSADGQISTHLWDCSAGRFRWHFWTDEIVHILDGEVHIDDEGGHSFVLRPGDVAHFAEGSSAVWHVPEYVRKLAFHRAAPLRRRVVRKLRALSPVGTWATAPWVLDLPERVLA